MDKDEFESKLKQIRRQKEQAEQELETASEKWRGERRRLNSEIDRLEGALAEAKESPRRRGASDAKPKGIDPAEVAKIQATADDRIKKATKEWEVERESLKKQIGRLERSVADAIERSNNPLRTTQSVRERFETQIVEITRRRDEIERAYVRDKTEWDQEKDKMNAELVKLRRTAQVLGRPIPEPDKSEVNPRIKELESKIQDLTAKWDRERKQLNDHASQLQAGFFQAQTKMQNYEAAAKSNEHYEAQLQDANRRTESMERELQSARDGWNTERKRLSADIERLEQQLQRTSENREKVSSEIVDQLRKQYEQKLQEAINQKTQLAQELQNASMLLETERARLSEEMSKAQSATVVAPTSDGSNGSMQPEVIDAELARVESMIHEIGKLIDDPAIELSTVIRKNVERAELDAYLKGILFSLGKGRGL